MADKKYPELHHQIRLLPPDLAERHRNALIALPALESVLVERIAARACGHHRTWVPAHVEKDLRIVHNVIAPLDLRRLLIAEIPEFLADLEGIEQHLDRHTMQLSGTFMPRYAMVPRMAVGA